MHSRDARARAGSRRAVSSAATVTEPASKGRARILVSTLTPDAVIHYDNEKFSIADANIGPVRKTAAWQLRHGSGPGRRCLCAKPQQLEGCTAGRRSPISYVRAVQTRRPRQKAGEWTSHGTQEGDLGCPTSCRRSSCALAPCWPERKRLRIPGLFRRNQQALQKSPVSPPVRSSLNALLSSSVRLPPKRRLWPTPAARTSHFRLAKSVFPKTRQARFVLRLGGAHGAKRRDTPMMPAPLLH